RYPHKRDPGQAHLRGAAHLHGPADDLLAGTMRGPVQTITGDETGKTIVHGLFCHPGSPGRTVPGTTKTGKRCERAPFISPPANLYLYRVSVVKWGPGVIWIN